MGEKLLITHRESAVLLERARVRVDGGRIVYDLAEGGTVRTFNVPYANLAVLFLGQGCSVTTDACRKLGEEGVFLAMTGTGGTPITFGTLINYRPTNHFRRAMTAWLSEDESLSVAKRMAHLRADNMISVGMRRMDSSHPAVADMRSVCERFKEMTDEARTGNELLGFEGDYAKSCYRVFAQNAFGRSGFVRETRKRSSDSPEDAANGMLDHGNYIIYGLAGAALWALGVPPHLSVLHGRTRAGGLVFDLADVFKDSLVLPLAFENAVIPKEGREKRFRAALLEDADRHKVLERCFEVFDECFPEEKA